MKHWEGSGMPGERLWCGSCRWGMKGDKIEDVEVVVNHFSCVWSTCR